VRLLTLQSHLLSTAVEFAMCQVGHRDSRQKICRRCDAIGMFMRRVTGSCSVSQRYRVMLPRRTTLGVLCDQLVSRRASNHSYARASLNVTTTVTAGGAATSHTRASVPVP